MKKTILALLLILFCLASSASAENLVMGTAAEYRPFVYYDFNDELTGLDIELINEIGKIGNFTVKPMDMAFDGLIDSLSVGQIDLIGGAFSKTESRMSQVLYSDVYYTNRSVLVALASGKVPNSVKLEDLKGYRIGVQRGSSYDQWLKTNLVAAGILNTQDVYTFASIDGSVKAMMSGTVDLTLMDNDAYSHTFESSGKFKIVNDKLGNEEYAFAAAPGQQALIARINDGLAKLTASGRLQEIITKYTQGAGEEAEITISRPSQIERTPAAYPTPTPIPPIDQPANCKNVLVYMSDVSYPDGTKVNPGHNFTKTWQIYNNGSCKWYEGYSIVFVDGDYMSANSAVVPKLTIPGTTVDVSMQMKAPQAPGQYIGYYQMRAPDGTFFGPKLTAKIIVTDEAVSEPPVGAPPVITRWEPNYYKGDNGFCPTIYWAVRDATAIHFSINNKRIYSTYYPSGSITLCPGGGKGDYVYGIVAEGTKKVSYVFTYTNTGGGKKQPNYFPTALPPRR